MSRLDLRAAGLSVALCAVMGCSKDAAKTDASAAAPASACSPEHTVVEDGGFCVKIPKTWEAQPPQKDDPTRLSFSWFRKGEGGIFVVNVHTKETLPADMNTMIGTPRGSTPTVTQGEIAGGKGKWISSVDGKSGVVEVAVTGPKGLIRCGVSGAPDSLEKSLELCKTILPL